MRRQHKVSLASLPTFPPSCPRILPLYPPSLRRYLCIILPLAPSISPLACVRRSGWSHKDGRGRAPLLLVLSSDKEAGETPAPEPQRPGPGCHGNGASPCPSSGPLSMRVQWACAGAKQPKNTCLYRRSSRCGQTTCVAAVSGETTKKSTPHPQLSQVLVRIGGRLFLVMNFPRF